jgi:cycloeucalenol cycloisomerase
MAARQRIERFYLGYSPLWMAAVFVLYVTRGLARWGDPEFLLFGLALALPVWIGPLVAPGPERGLPLRARYSVKAAAFITLLAFVQNYLGADLFFRCFGMQYHFPVRLSLRGTPVFLYLMTVAYFATYFAAIQLALRLFRTCFPAARGLHLAAQALLCYGVALSETLFMANDRLRDYFSYADKTFVMAYGSIAYGALLFIALSVFQRIDEDPRRPTPLRRVLWDGLAVNMLVLLLYELYAAVVPRCGA